MKPLWECILILTLAAILTLLSLWLDPKRPDLIRPEPDAPEVQLDIAVTWPPPVLWVDARPDEAFRLQHIPDAIPLNERSWEQELPGFLAAWKPDTRVIIYCDSRTCDASQSVARRIARELKLPDIFVLKRGWAAWQQTHP